ncbi:hypothetical protein LIER_10631 [Lithospermum erythrorhizon]|uniref:Uncharacterized protein n=1 Tax=Lithospermum erythrorhizon TaxID=34254 RepID=A0AAV3PQ08_LITER
MPGFIRERNHEGHTDDTYMALYREKKNLLSVRVHYHFRFVANPSLSYEGGKVELFDCGYVRIRFVSLTDEHKFINVCFSGTSNTELLEIVDDGGGSSISVSRAST